MVKINRIKQTSIYQISLLLLVGFLPSIAFAQTKDGFVVESDDIDDAEVLIEKETVLTLPLASRVFDQMQRVEREKVNTQQQYTLQLINYDLEKLNPDLSYKQISRVPHDIPYHNYIKAGIGNYITPYLDGFFGSKPSDQYAYHAQVKHLSSLQGPVDNSNSGAGISSIDLGGKYFLPIGKVSANLGFENRFTHFYGYGELPEGIEIERDSINQVFNTFYGDIGFDYDNDSQFKMQNSLNFHVFNDHFQVSEYNFNLGVKPSYELNENMEASLGINLILSERSDLDTVETTRNLFFAAPSLTLKGDRYRVRLGAKLAYNGDTTNTDQEFYIFPNIYGHYDLIENKLSVFGGAVGNLHQRTLRGFTQENPWISPNTNLAHTNEIVKASLGLQASPVNNIGLKIQGAYSLSKNLYFFINNSLDTTRFDIAYEDESVGILNISGELSADFNSFKTVFRSSFYNYNLGENIQEAWHRPRLVNNLMVKYNHQDQLFFDLNFYHLNGLQALNVNTGESIKLDDIFDLNIKGEYQVLENITAFISLENLLAKNYQRYLNYDSRGLRVILGGSFSF